MQNYVSFPLEQLAKGQLISKCPFGMYLQIFQIFLLLGSHIRHGSMVILQLFLVFLPIILGVLLHLLLQPQALYLRSDTNLNIKVHEIFLPCFRSYNLEVTLGI